MNAKPFLRIATLIMAGMLAWTCNFPDTSDPDPSKGDPGDTLKTPDSNGTGPHVNHAPTIGLGLHNVSMLEGESKTITLKAKDEDGDPMHFEVQNLDSLRALFPDGAKAIEILTGGDSLVIGFLPGPSKGNYRFRIAVMDPFGGIEVQILTISVGKVNRPPSVAFAAPVTGTAFKIKEGGTLSIKVTAQDVDGDAVTLQSLANPPWPRFGQGSYDTKTGMLTFTPSFQCVASGETTFSDLVFRAKDNGSPSESGQISARITVQDSNSAPVWKTAAQTLQGREGMEMILDLGPLFKGDGENDAVDFTAACGAVNKAAMKWSFTPGFRDAGRKECAIIASDSHKPPAASKLILTLDISDSVRLVDVAITSPVSGSISKDSVVPVIWTIGDQVQTAETAEILKVEGANVIVRSFRDSLGNNGSDSVTVIRDTRPPLPPRITVPALLNTPLPKWIWKSGGEGNGKYRLRLDNPDPGAPMAEVRDTAFTPSAGLPEGRHVLYVEEQDDAGNWSAPDSGAVVLDLTPPVVKILSPLPGIRTNASSIEVRWMLDGQEQQTQNSEPLSADGVVMIRREALDAAGNRGADSILIFRKSQPGAAPTVTGTAVPTRNPEWTWTSGGQGGSGAYRIGWQAGVWFDTLTATRFAGPADLADGAQTLFVSELDSAGNWSAPGSFQVTVDKTPPILQVTGPDLQASIASIDPVITGTATEANGLAAVRYSLAGAGNGVAVLAGASWSIATLAYPDGDHLVAVVGEDAAGNLSAPVSVPIHKRTNTVFVRKGSTGNGTSWKDAFGELYQVFANPIGASGLKVWMADGEYPTAPNLVDPITVPSKVEVYGGFNPDGSGKSVLERNLADLKTSVRCDGLPQNQAILLQGQGAILDGIRFTTSGGAIGSTEGNSVRNCWILNTGGIAPIRISGAKGDSFQLINSRIDGNRSADQGALVLDADVKASLTDTWITNNSSTGQGSGGGMWIGSKAKVTAQGTTLSGNTVPDSVGTRPIQVHVEADANLNYEGTVEGGTAGFDIMPKAKVKYNGVDIPDGSSGPGPGPGGG
ncbi:MAG: hypothetical protein JWO30_2002 [Fibrobacteres bacterium]|nr:hypothetical protein [Fibrobacterota bacterium]